MPTDRIQVVNPRILSQHFPGTTPRWWVRRMKRLDELGLTRKQGKTRLGRLAAIAEALLTEDLGSGLDT